MCLPQIEIRPNEPVEIAIRKFKRACERAGIGADVRKKIFYEKPAWERKRKKIAAIKRTDRGKRRITGSVTTSARTGAMIINKPKITNRFNRYNNNPYR